MPEYDLRTAEREQDFDILLIDGTVLPPIDSSGHLIVGISEDGRNQPIVATLEKYWTITKPGSVKHISPNGLLLDVVPITSIVRFKIKDKFL
jgi:hypothetical protein